MRVYAPGEWLSPIHYLPQFVSGQLRLAGTLLLVIALGALTTGIVQAVLAMLTGYVALFAGMWLLSRWGMLNVPPSLHAREWWTALEIRLGPVQRSMASSNRSAEQQIDAEGLHSHTGWHQRYNHPSTRLHGRGVLRRVDRPPVRNQGPLRPLFSIALVWTSGRLFEQTGAASRGTRPNSPSISARCASPITS
ncbi:MAG: hypothetical protein WDO73_16385 [Ignavibacteriota bacterium]